MRLSRSTALGLACALVILAGIGDHVSGDDIAFTLIYLGPVALATWTAGRTGGLLVAAAAALSSLVAGRSYIPPLSLTVQFWNLAIERARRHGRPFTVALLDLDGFKQVNDTLGHEAGDEALVTVSGVLHRRLRVVDVVARLGGDEFALLLPETAASAAATVFQDLLKQVPSSMQGRGWPVGLSLGAVTFNSAPRNLDDALREADTLLYEAKRAGKGRLRHETRPAGS
jgi:diguanylate cyclase (GGDEF)-like protein